MASLKIYECYDENNKKDLTLEVWASSTKYPDAKFYFADFNKSEWCAEEHQVFQWLLECASKMRFPFTAKQIADLAYEKYITWEKPREAQAFFIWRAAGERMRREFPLYHLPANLSIRKLHKIFTKFFPKIVHFAH